MANADTEVTLPQLKTAMMTAIQAQFPALQTVQFMRIEEAEDLPTPALLLEVVEFDEQSEEDVGTGQFPAMVRFEARVIWSSHLPNSKTQAHTFALALSTWLYRRRFPGACTDPVRGINGMPDQFAPRADRWEVWVVEFAITALFGDSVWNDDGVVPRALYSFKPDIGAQNVEKYIELDGGGAER